MAFRFLTIVALLLSIAPSFISIRPFSRAEAAEGNTEDEEKEKKKPKPFRYSAWCSFQDPSKQLKAEADIETEFTRPGSTQWMGFGRRGQWAHIVLEVENTTEDVPVKGVASIDLNPFNALNQTEAYQTLYQRSFEVPPQSIRQYHMSVLCPEGGWQQVLVNVTANGIPRQPRPVTLRDLDQQHEDLIVVLSDSPSEFLYLAAQTRETTDDGTEIPISTVNNIQPANLVTGRKVAVVTPEDLPSRWHDLKIATLIIIDGPPKQKLSAEQWEALRVYAQSGGQILITAGNLVAPLKGEIEDLAGITVREMASVESLEALAQPFRFPPNKKGSVLQIVDAKVTQAGGAIPRYHPVSHQLEMSRRFFGSGSVTFLPFSLNNALLKTWEGRLQIPASLLLTGAPRVFRTDASRNDQDDLEDEENRSRPWERRQRPAPGVDTLPGFRAALDESFSNDTPVKMQKPDTVLSFLLFYLLCAVPGNFLIFGWLKRREVAWLAVPVWAGSFSFIAYMVGYMGQTGQLTVNEISVVEAGPRQGSGVARTFVGIYAPKRDYYRVEFPGAEVGAAAPFLTHAAPGHLLSRALAANRHIDTPSAEIVDTDDGLAISRIRIQERSTRRLEVVHRANLGDGVDLRITSDGNGGVAQVDVANNTGRDLLYPVFIHDGRAVEMALIPGGDQLRSGDAAQRTNINWGDPNEVFFGKNFNFRTVGGPHSQKRTQMVSQYMRDHAAQFNGGVFCAWIEAGMLPVSIGAEGDKPAPPGSLEGLTLLLVPAPADDRVNLESLQGFSVNWSGNDPNISTVTDWQPLTGRTAPLSRESRDGQKPAKTFLKLELPSNFLNFYNAGRDLQLRFKLGSSNKQSPTQMYKVSVKIYKRKVRNTPVPPETLLDEAFVNVTPNKAGEIVTVPLSLGDSNRRDGNAVYLGITAEPTQTQGGNGWKVELQSVEVRPMPRRR